MGTPIHDSGYIQNKLKGDGKRNEYYCIAGGAIPTKTCIKGM